MSLLQNMLLGRRGSIFDLSDAFRGLPSDDAGAADVHMDWKETPEAHVFKADLPGVGKGEVMVEVEDGRVLSISGERTDDKEEECEWHCTERSRGRFFRRFRLPEDAKVDEMKASMENGVLTLVVPKVEMKKPVEVRAIEITGGGAGKKRGKGKEDDGVCCSFWPLRA